MREKINKWGNWFMIVIALPAQLLNYLSHREGTYFRYLFPWFMVGWYAAAVYKMLPDEQENLKMFFNTICAMSGLIWMILIILVGM